MCVFLFCARLVPDFDGMAHETQYWCGFDATLKQLWHLFQEANRSVWGAGAGGAKAAAMRSLAIEK